MKPPVTAGRISRRRFSAITGGTLAAFALGSACDGSEQAFGGDARLTARPKTDRKTTAAGSHPLGLGTDRDAVLHIPEKAGPDPIPLLILLHGAGGSGTGILRRLQTYADDAGVAVLAPDSRGSTWDAIRGTFGADVVFLNRALEKVFEVVAADPARLAVGGFSDGATYALSVGLLNGDLFRRVLAFSPGFFVGGTAQGKPEVFVSHGTGDTVLPIDRCSRVIVPVLKKQGYDVTFRQFDGGHEIPQPIAAEGMRWVRRP